jgi:hypothetical protein
MVQEPSGGKGVEHDRRAGNSEQLVTSIEKLHKSIVFCRIAAKAVVRLRVVIHVMLAGLGQSFRVI